MRRRRVDTKTAIVGGLLLVAVVVVILKWLLITTAILAVPFGIWWLQDREKRKSAEWEERRRAAATPRPRIDPDLEARIADEQGLPHSAAFWRSQPPAPPLADEQEWQARKARGTANGTW